MQLCVFLCIALLTAASLYTCCSTSVLLLLLLGIILAYLSTVPFLHVVLHLYSITMHSVVVGLVLFIS